MDNVLIPRYPELTLRTAERRNMEAERENITKQHSSHAYYQEEYLFFANSK